MPNALAREKSPYLLQHAHNPVAWRPWGEAALAEARAAQKPIFLSIGYSTCHWCHVMAHESFEDEGIAALLNAHFIPVKLDREERPDVDKVYMAYVQALTGHGGWPLSAWLTPELKPFFGGTYFPPEDRPGRAGFGSILRAIARGWETERDKLVAEGERVIGTLREHREPPAAGEAGDFAEAGGAAFEQCFQHLHESFDAAQGGFGGAPKFPRAANFFFLLRVAAIQGGADGAGREAAHMAAATLAKMAQGGIHDHVGGGYHRYSVDDAWFVPHFEKMLYDQAQLALAHLEARLATGDERHAWIARGILAYVARDLTQAAGGFFTAEDADSDDGAGGHAEGAFYVWTEAELRESLGESFPLVAAHYGVLAAGNVPAQHDPHGELRGKNILAQARPLAETAPRFGLGTEAASEALLAALEKLRVARARRTRPLLDDKILTATNGLMISAYARASQLLESDPARPAVAPYLAAAVRAAEFVERELWEGATATLYRTWRGGRSEIAAFAEDYAYFAQGLLDLYAASFDVRWLRWAERVQARMDELFFDAEHGGHFNSAAGATDIVLRLMEDYDGAEPAPSSVAAMNLLRLGALLHDEVLRARGKKCLAAFRSQWTRAPHAVPQMLCALELALDTPRHVVLAGDPRAADFRALAAVLHERPGPRRTVLALTSDGDREFFSTRAPWLAEMRAIAGRATAYVCEDFACQAPVTEPAALRALLGGGA